MAKKKKNSDGYDGDSYDDNNGQLNLDDQLFNADKRHYRDTEQFVIQNEKLYQRAIKTISEAATEVGIIPQNEPFSFKHNKAAEKKVMQAILDLASSIEATIDAGCRHEWEAACIKGDEYIKRIMATSQLTKEQVKRYQDRNLEQLAAFQERKVEGLNLSERVWKMVQPLKDEVELAVDTTAQYFNHGVGINDAITKIQSAMGRGTSAAELSRDIRECLQHPDKLFRRVKDKYGNLTLSKAAKLYHPGQGVYRSSYKNAMRLTRSEINMAYRQSDTMRWQQLDFVVGMEVNLSNNHTTPDPKSHRKLQLIDICDELKGKYPKDFKFVGWHPQCRCYMTPILKTREEMNRDRQNMDDPDYVPEQSVNAVTDTPAGFQQYMQDNAPKIQGWKSTPYYIKDNLQYVDAALNGSSFTEGLLLTAEQTKIISDFQAFANNHQENKAFATTLQHILKAKADGDRDEFYIKMKRAGAIFEQYPEGSDFSFPAKITAELKHKIYEKPFKEQFIEIQQDGSKHKIMRHILKEYKSEDYQQIIKAANAYSANDDVWILPEIHKSETDIRRRLGITSETRVPDLKVGSVFIDVKSPKKQQNIVRNANSASGQGAIACITNELCTIKTENINRIAQTVLSESKYTHGEVHFLIDGVLNKYNGQGLLPGQGSAPSRGALNGYQSLRGAKVSTSSQTTNNQPDNSAQASSKRQVLIHKRVNPKEKRHEWDDRIAELKAKASKYHLDTEAIDHAYTSLDLTKLEQAVTSQEQLLARRTKTYAATEKKHQQRTKADIEAMQTAWNMRRAKAYGFDKYIDEAEELVTTHGIDRTQIDSFMAKKQGKNRTEFEAKITKFKEQIEEAKNQKEIDGLVRMTELSGISHQLKQEGGAKANRLAKKIQGINKSLMKRKDSVAYINSKEYQQIITDAKQQLEAIKAHRAEARKQAKEWANKRESQTGETKLTRTLDSLKRNGIDSLYVKKLDKKLTDEEIIERVAGGDKTKGSCSSLALCFAGNKGGLDVLDFRGGESQDFFSTKFNLKRMIKEAGGLVEWDTDDNEAAKRLWAKMQEGKYYYFVTGGHAAIIRIRDIGTGGKRKMVREYLELQSPLKGYNRFEPLNKQILKSRFGAEFDQKNKVSSLMIDIDILINDPGFRKMLEYINTEESKQIKGRGGSTK